MTVSWSFPARFARRVRRRRISRAKVLLGLLGLSGVLALTAWVLLASSLFGVAHVRVQGIQRLDAAQVVQRAAIDPGAPLARLDTAAVAARIARLPAVAGVDVRRDWPRGVTVVVQERVAAAVRENGASFALVDRSGVVFGELRKRPKNLPLVTAPTGAGAPALRAALDALDDVPPSVRGQVRTVLAANPEEVTLQLTRGRTVVWGDPSGAGGRKGAVLAVLLSRHARIYDVSVPDAPTTRQ